MKIDPIIRDVCCVLGLALLGAGRQERWLSQPQWMQSRVSNSQVWCARSWRTIRTFALPSSGGWRLKRSFHR